jgi:hypothetical protein
VPSTFRPGAPSAQRCRRSQCQWHQMCAAEPSSLRLASRGGGRRSVANSTPSRTKGRSGLHDDWGRCGRQAPPADAAERRRDRRSGVHIAKLRPLHAHHPHRLSDALRALQAGGVRRCQGSEFSLSLLPELLCRHACSARAPHRHSLEGRGEACCLRSLSGKGVHAADD